jgi:hypothetical protein
MDRPIRFHANTTDQFQSKVAYKYYWSVNGVVTRHTVVPTWLHTLDYSGSAAVDVTTVAQVADDGGIAEVADGDKVKDAEGVMVNVVRDDQEKTGSFKQNITLQGLCLY